ncbi:hypothetical protein SCUCBS95973_008662 [Sporothrix curviconia]|uniref:Major facilitator superfamily transporter n=1 Tax=Sporothrix curviconia TaxID=1260050 RepID=A0ABP0CR11_9PEZI
MSSSPKVEPIAAAAHAENIEAGGYTTSDSEAHAITRGFETELGELPKGYFMSRFFVGSMAATACSLMTCVGSFGLAASIISQINEELGQDPRYTWISMIYNVSLAVFFTPSIPVLIGGNVLLGAASLTQLSFHYVMGELVPIKYRYLGLALLYAFCIPFAGVGSIISFAFLDHTAVGWPGVYWVLLGFNALNFKKHRHDDDDIRRVGYWLRHFDNIGTFLFAAGFVLFLLGLSWGGSTHPWTSAAVICAIVLGVALLVVFGVWETPASSTAPPTLSWALSAIPGTAIVVGQCLGGYLAPKIGRATWQCAFVLIAGGAMIACMATAGGDPSTRATCIGLLFVGITFLGYNEAIALAGTTLLDSEQGEIGVAGGLGSSFRSAIASVITAVYVTILTNRLATTVPAQVPPALEAAGLPESSVAAFLEAAAAGTTTAANAATSLAASIPGLTQNILDIGNADYRNANADAYHTVYPATIAFTALAVVLALLGRNTEAMMTDKVVATLANEDDQLTRHGEPGKSG